MKKNTASQIVGAQMISATDGSAFTGSVTVSVTGDGGTQATGSVGSGACTHEGNGYHTYAPAQAETNYDHVAFTFTGSGAIPATVQVYPSFPQTGDSYARLGAPAGASVSADIAAIEAQTDDIGVAGAGLTAVPWNAAWDAEVQSEVADALAAYDPPTNAEMVARTLATADYATATSIDALPTAAENADAVWDEALSGHTTAGTAGKGLSDAGSAGDPWSTALPGSYTAGQAGKIVGDNLNATVSSRATPAQVAAELATYDGPTNAEMTARTLASASYATAANQTTIAGYLDTEVAAIKAKTDNLPASPAATGDIPSAATVATAVLETAMTESYSTAGGTKTVAQALYEIGQMLQEKAVASTTLTVKKLDGTTSAMTFTLDDATTPTSITRAT